MSEFKAEIVALISKWWLWVVFIFMGVVAKFSYDLTMRKKINFWQAMGSVGLSIVAGLVTAHYCINNGYEKKGYYIVIFVVIFSRDIFTYLLTHWKSILHTILRLPMDKKE